MSGPKEGILASLLLAEARPGFKVGRFTLIALIAASTVAAVCPVVALHPPIVSPLHHLLILPMTSHCIH